MNKRFSILFVALLPFSFAKAQDYRLLQEMFREAEYFFISEEYSDAVDIYLQIYSEMPENANVAFRIGACYINIYGKKDLSIRYLEAASRNMSAKYREGNVRHLAAPYVTLYELARAYRINFNFDKAKETFLQYKTTLLPNDFVNINFIDQEIRACDFAKIFIANPRSFTEENIGEFFNDEKPNFNPVMSADGKTFVYMSALKFYDAIMFSRLQNDRWSDPVNIFPDLQIDGKVSISCLSKEGTTLFFSIIEGGDNSNIYYSTFNGTVWSPAAMLNRNINTRHWESHASLSEDGQSLVFASDRPGGFGGLDLYVSTKVNNEWGPAINMGPIINTPFNEDRPFFSSNDNVLIFCSQGHENMGGYDLFRSDRLNENWGKPVNMGFPLNTPDDDTYFMPYDGGKSGYIFKEKESEGFGGNDIYKIILR